MKRFFAIALIALVSLFALDGFANLGVTQAVTETVKNMSAGDCLTVGLATLPVAAVVAADVKKEAQKLWVITQDEYDELKAKYRHLYIIDVAFDADERYQFIARRPNKTVIDAVAANKGDTAKCTELMMKNMLVAGDLDALDDGVVYSRVLESIGGIMKEGKNLFSKA